MKTTKKSVWFNLADIITDRSATGIVRHAPLTPKEKTAAKKVLLAQPGYHKGRDMGVRRTVKGGYRLYVVVGGRYMDASLSDLPELV